jgi:F-type H+-transporting ATPase subunit a
MIVSSILLLLGGIFVISRKTKVPGRLQNAIEMITEGLRGTFMSALGPGGERHLPLIYGLFWYIIFCNIIELIPIFHAVTANPSNTIGLGLIVFVYSQYVGIKSKGLWNYLKHFAGPVLFLLPLLLPIEIIGECIKPFTLGMRLFGNIYAEDIMHEMAAGGGWIMVPVQVVICALQVFTGLIQAYIFSLLSCAYIGLMAEHHEEHGDDHGHVEATAHA